MKALLILMTLPFIILAQSSVKVAQKPFNSGVLTEKIQPAKSVAFSLPEFHGKTDNTNQQWAKGTTKAALSLGNPSSALFQDTSPAGKIFTKDCLTDFKQVSSNLRISFYLKYGANLIGIIRTLKSYNDISTKNVDENEPLVDMTNRTRFVNILDFTVYSMEFHALNTLGRAGSGLYSLSAKLPESKSFEFFEASRRLKKARTYGLISQSLNLIGSTAMLYGFSQNSESNTFTRGLVIGGSFGLASLVFKYISVNNIGSAGEVTKRFSDNLTDKWQKEYFNGFSKSLINYKRNWRTGLTLTFTGISLFLTAMIMPAPPVAVGSAIVGGVLIFAGNIYMNWVAPYSLSSAADNLSGLERSLKKE